jgi:hypothetical protein
MISCVSVSFVMCGTFLMGCDQFAGFHGPEPLLQEAARAARHELNKPGFLVRSFFSSLPPVDDRSRVQQSGGLKDQVSTSINVSKACSVSPC